MKNGKGLFGLMIKRKEKGMTQKDLGKIVGVRSEAISCYEVKKDLGKNSEDCWLEPEDEKFPWGR